MKPVVAYLRGLGIRLIIYLDDLLILNSSITGLLQDLKIIIDLLERLGFILNYKKSVTNPQQLLEWLGMLIDCLPGNFPSTGQGFFHFDTMQWCVTCWRIRGVS